MVSERRLTQKKENKQRTKNANKGGLVGKRKIKQVGKLIDRQITK
jgi:hypothetical protein